MKKAMIVALMTLLFLASAVSAQSSGATAGKGIVVPKNNDLKDHIDLVLIVGHSRFGQSWKVLGVGFITGDDTVIGFKSCFDFIKMDDYVPFGVGIIDSHAKTLEIENILLIKKVIIHEGYLKFKVDGHLLEYW